MNFLCDSQAYTCQVRTDNYHIECRVDVNGPDQLISQQTSSSLPDLESGNLNRTLKMLTSMEGLDRYLVPGTNEAYYIPNFVTEEEEEYLVRKVRGCVQTLLQVALFQSGHYSSTHRSTLAHATDP